MLYNIFYVGDYKGGELHSNINLSEEEYIHVLFGDDILRYLRFHKSKEAPSRDDIEVYFERYSPEWWYNPYAYDTWGGLEVYQVDNNRLTLIDPKDISIDTFVKVFIDLYKQWLRSEK